MAAASWGSREANGQNCGGTATLAGGFTICPPQLIQIKYSTRETRASHGRPAVKPKVNVNNGLVDGKVKIDPWLIGTGITYRF